MDKLRELEKRIQEYVQHAKEAENAALEKIREYPERKIEMTEADVLRRELLRHHTRILLLDEIQEWIDELQGMCLYQLYSGNGGGRQFSQNVRQYMTEKEAAEVNATYKTNGETLRWARIEPCVLLAEELESSL
ncbi:hypothetical protein CSB45_07585 [candidate division KSB3 bacterium]|uniref:Uncharacterized protein n=1 Tax=candidate division KSB3 bacterium TaxID=2044937 RepID=A0A2G6E6G9_9BACT|nr:MAG: hypothetical protein CSB45_07585 [candidate division KSB3 bacterium]PIE29897.1 MAG: hypothetical protein CSA57_06290 [candidate division KSB3 bacterium]